MVEKLTKHGNRLLLSPSLLLLPTQQQLQRTQPQQRIQEDQPSVRQQHRTSDFASEHWTWQERGRYTV